MSEVKVDTISERTAAGGVTIDGVLVKDGTATFQTAAGSPLVFEGATADAFETTFAITDPTADRTITFPDSSFTVPTSGGLTTASQWRLTADFTGTATPIASNLEEADAPVGFGVLGSSMAESSGIFTFPSTGYWLVVFEAMVDGSAHSHGVIDISTTTDNSTYAKAAEGRAVAYYGYGNPTCSFVQDVSDVTQDKVQFNVNNSGATITTRGDTAVNETSMTFTKLADR